jgi:hypothetical protein
MTFPEPLTEDQRQILYINLDSITEGLVHKLNAMLSEIEHGWVFKGMRALPTNHMTSNLMKAAITHALFNFQLYIYRIDGYYQEVKDEEQNVVKITLVKDPRIVTFLYAKDELALAKFKQARFLNPVDEDRVYNGLKKFIFPDMKIDPSKVLLETGWVEKV